VNLFEQIGQGARARGLEFLVIGAHALNHFGYSRETADVDLLVIRDQRVAWRDWLLSLGYSVFHDAEVFAQFSPPAQGAWPVDLMFVKAETFGRMRAESVEASIGPAVVRFPSVEHLLALKVHALRHAGLHRFLKDYQDVIGLIVCNRLDPRSEKMRQIFEKHGSLELYEKVVRECS
jgi:hypothetical protein